MPQDVLDAMAGNVLWTNIFNKPDSQSQELTRQRIIQEGRPGRRPAQPQTPSQQYDDIISGRGPGVPVDPWPRAAREVNRTTIGAPILGYGGSVPLLRPEHVGTLSEAQAAWKDKTVEHREAARIAPGGGASAMGTAPSNMPGVRATGKRNSGLFDALREAERII